MCCQGGRKSCSSGRAAAGAAAAAAAAALSSSRGGSDSNRTRISNSSSKRAAAAAAVAVVVLRQWKTAEQWHEQKSRSTPYQTVAGTVSAVCHHGDRRGRKNLGSKTLPCTCFLRTCGARDKHMCRNYEIRALLTHQTSRGLEIVKSETWRAQAHTHMHTHTHTHTHKHTHAHAHAHTSLGASTMWSLCRQPTMQI